MKTKLMIAVFGLSTAMIGCGSDDKESGEKISHTTTQQGLSANTTAISERVAAAGGFLDNADFLNLLLQNAPVPTGSSTVSCDSEGNCSDVEVDPIDSEPLEFDLGVSELGDAGEELAQALEETIFTQNNVESSTATSITYLVSGVGLCDGDSGCLQSFEELELRVKVTSPAQDDYDLELLVGPQRANPFLVSLYNDRVGAEIDLAGVKSAANHLESIGAIDDIELPSTMQGRLRGEIAIEGQNAVSASVSVLTAIDVRDGMFGIQVAEAQPAMKLTIDGDAQTVESQANWGAIDIQTIIEGLEGSDDLDIHIGGSTATVLIDVAKEALEITNIGLGSTTTTAKLNGEQFVGIDLNPNDGRTFDVSVAASSDDALELTFSPKMDLNLALELANAMDAFDDVEDWMMDEVISVVIDGAASPRILIEEAGVRVLDGQVSMSMQNAAISHTATAGQCLVEASSDVEGPNPMEAIEVAACE